MRQKIIQADNLTDINSTIDELISAGWVLFGPINVTFDGTDLQYTQQLTNNQ